MKADAGEETGKLKPKIAAIALVAFTTALTAYIYIAHLIGLHALYAGSCVLFYWAGFEKFNLRALPNVVIGSLGGILNGALFALLPPVMGEGIGALVALLVLLAAIYLLLVGWLPQLFNQAYMLLLTVALIPPVLAEGRFLEMAAGVLYGAAFWGGIVLAGALLKQRRAMTARA